MVPSNKVHLLWQLPQYIIITASEIMFSITGLEFSFTQVESQSLRHGHLSLYTEKQWTLKTYVFVQAPPSMKTILSAVWLLTNVFGNLIVVVISEIEFFDTQVRTLLSHVVSSAESPPIEVVLWAYSRVLYVPISGLRISVIRRADDNWCFLVNCSVHAV